MSDIIYDSAAQYVTSATTLQERLVKVQTIIMALLDLQITQAAGKSAITQYTLNDGQTVISASYRSAKELDESITAYQNQETRLLNMLNGRMMRLRDQSNFPHR